VKTSELTSVQLDAWVARAEGICLHEAPHTKSCGNWGTDYTCAACGKDPHEGANVRTYHPSTDWAQGGPIIERENVHLEHYEPHAEPKYWIARMRHPITGQGPSALVSAMRAYVASRYGDEVSVEPVGAERKAP
jgi:hypothetical protein